MIYLTGVLPKRFHDQLARDGRLGLLLSWRHTRFVPPGMAWAADNACFNAPEIFPIRRYLNWLRSPRGELERCLFATVPDVVGDAEATLRRFDRYAPMMTPDEIGQYRLAFVAQDGLEQLADSIPWDEFGCWFVGGSDDWKLSEASYELMAEAKRRGKWLHMGRVNSERRLRAAMMAGCDSADGTFLKFGVDENVGRMLRWFSNIEAQPHLFGSEGSGVGHVPGDVPLAR